MNDLPTLMQLSTSPEAAGTGIVQRPAVVPGAAQVALARGAIEVTWARHLDEVREAQRLRFEVFAAEMGARLTTPVPGHDVDLFDDYCEHLLVRDAEVRGLRVDRGGHPRHAVPAGPAAHPERHPRPLQHD